MAKYCSICTKLTEEKRNAINEALLKGSAISHVAKHFSVDYQQLYSHFNNCLKYTIHKVDSYDAMGLQLLRQLNELQKESFQVLAKTKKGTNPKLTLEAIRECRENIMAAFKLINPYADKVQIDISNNIASLSSNDLLEKLAEINTKLKSTGPTPIDGSIVPDSLQTTESLLLGSAHDSQLEEHLAEHGTTSVTPDTKPQSAPNSQLNPSRHKVSNP